LCASGAGREVRAGEDLRGAGDGGDADRDEAARAHRRGGGHQPVGVLPRAERESEVERGQAVGERVPRSLSIPLGQVDRDALAVVAREVGEQRGMARARAGRVRPLPNRAVDQHAAVRSRRRSAGVGGARATAASVRGSSGATTVTAAPRRASSRAIT
jgi:hypothetical protein